MGKSGMAGGLNDAFGDPDRSRQSQRLARVAHAALPVTVAVLGVRGVEWFMQLPKWLDWTTTVIMIAVVLVAILHQDLARICVRCMERTLADDAPARAQRLQWALWLQHVTWNMTVWFGIWAVLIGAQVLIDMFVYPGIAEGDPRDNWIYAPGDILFAAYVYAIVTHHRLSPWCPYCRWGSGGSHEAAPAPTPDPSGVKSS